MGTFVKVDYWEISENICQYDIYEGRLPIFHTAAEGIYYFTDKKFTMDTLCQNYTETDLVPQHEFHLRNSGKLHVKPGCIAYTKKPYRMMILPPTGQLAVMNMSTFNKYDIIKVDRTAMRTATVLEHTVDLANNNFTIPAINASVIYLLRNQTGILNIPLDAVHQVTKWLKSTWSALTDWINPFSALYWAAILCFLLAMLYVISIIVRACNMPRKGQYDPAPQYR
jgi:hypothetical protein